METHIGLQSQGSLANDLSTQRVACVYLQQPILALSSLQCRVFVFLTWCKKFFFWTNLIVIFLSRSHTHLTAFFGTTQVSRYQKRKTNLDFTEARDSEWQWHQLGHMQVCTSLQTDNHASTPPLRFLQAGRPSCRPTDSVKALKINFFQDQLNIILTGCRGAREQCGAQWAMTGRPIE